MQCISSANMMKQFEVDVTILNHPRHDERTFHEEIKPTEMNVNKEKIEALSDPVSFGDLTTTANVAEINRNFVEHQYLFTGVCTWK